jgi:hypothetical protein
MQLGRRMTGARLALAALAAILLLAACQRDKGDPVKISREFIVAVWTGDVQRVDALTCDEWRTVTTAWAREGDPSVTVDTEHMHFELYAENDDLAVVIATGIVTFRSASGAVEVRDLDEMGFARFTLIDEKGWKVCDVRGE